MYSPQGNMHKRKCFWENKTRSLQLHHARATTLQKGQPYFPFSMPFHQFPSIWVKKINCIFWTFLSTQPLDLIENSSVFCLHFDYLWHIKCVTKLFELYIFVSSVLELNWHLICFYLDSTCSTSETRYFFYLERPIYRGGENRQSSFLLPSL